MPLPSETAGDSARSSVRCRSNSNAIFRVRRRTQAITPYERESVHEYLSMDLLQQYGVKVPPFQAAFSPEEALSKSKSFPSPKQVIKAQVLAGGRGKGHFDSGLQGGVQMVDTPEQARDFAQQMLGNKLITKQTGAAGRVCNAVRCLSAFRMDLMRKNIGHARTTEAAQEGILRRYPERPVCERACACCVQIRRYEH
jgi:hypothetical protein